MNPIDTDPRVTADMMAKEKLMLRLLGDGIKKVISRFMGDDFAFVLIIRHKTQAKTMLIVADVDKQEEITEIITEAYERHKSPEINKYNDTELNTPVNQH